MQPTHTELLAMPGNCVTGSRWQRAGNVRGNVRGDVRHFAWLCPPPVPTALACHPGNAPLAAALRLHAHRDCGNASAAAAALCLHAHRACGNARQLFYGIPKATCQVTSGVTSSILLGCTPSSYTTHQYTTHHTPLINTPLIIHH